MQWWEHGDVPCHFRTLNRDLTDGNHLTHSPYWNGCSGRYGDEKTVSFEDNPRYYVRGLAVCDSKNNGNDRVKGIKIVAAKVWKTKKQIDNLNVTATATHPNCGAWKRTVYCPSGKVASGFVVYYGIGLGSVGVSKEVTGMSLVCKKVKWD